MVQLRRNYPSRGGLQTTFRVILFIIFMLILAVAGFIYYKKGNLSFFDQQPLPTAMDKTFDLGRTYLPTCNGTLVHHKYYSLCYIEKDEESSWVAYTLDRDNLNVPNIPRNGRFSPDPDIRTHSAVHSDYTGSGYTRGHLVPVGDMSFDSTAMRETFYMSNISPQLRGFNNGIWKELEENVRDWAYSHHGLYIISGPVLTKGLSKHIGKNGVAVPSYFYKVLLEYNEKGKAGIGFLIPHEISTLPLQSYMVPIDSIEQITGIDFFRDFLSEKEQASLESVADKSSWKVSDARYRLRVSKWNYE